MGEIAEMMLDGTLCECCGSFIDFGGGSGFPRYCSPQCARDRGVTCDEPMTKAERRDRPIDRGEKVRREPGGDPQQRHKPWLCECGRRFRIETGARDHWRDTHGEKGNG